MTRYSPKVGRIRFGVLDGERLIGITAAFTWREDRPESCDAYDYEMMVRDALIHWTMKKALRE